MSPRVLVITSCTARKVYQPPHALTREDFQSAERLARRQEALRAWQLPAGVMYTGGQHVDFMQGVQTFRGAGGILDIAILSAGYGLLHENDPIVPYDVTFANLSPAQIHRWSLQQNMKHRLSRFVASYDLVFFLLGRAYLMACDLPIARRTKQVFIFLAGRSQHDAVLHGPDTFLLGLGNPEAAVFHRGLVRLKGFLYAQLLSVLQQRHQSAWTSVLDHPDNVRRYLLDSLDLCDSQLLRSLGTDRDILPWSVGFS